LIIFGHKHVKEAVEWSFWGFSFFSHITNTVLVPGRHTLVVSLVMAANTVTFGKKSVGNLSTTTFQTKLSDFYGNWKK
jgi:hypothetical protein